MKAIWTTLGILISLGAMAGFLWLIGTASDHVWPEAKWFFIAIFVAIWVFMFARLFRGGISAYRDILDAYIHRRIETRDLPPDFRFITHDTTLAEVAERLGPASRIVQLALPHRDGDTEHFMAHEYDLPYEAAVIVMPQRPFEPDDRIRAVSIRKRSNEDELFAPVRS